MWSDYLDIANIFWVARAQIVDEAAKGGPGPDKWIPGRLLGLERGLEKNPNKI